MAAATSNGAVILNQHPIGTGTGATTNSTNLVQGGSSGIAGLPPKSSLAQQSMTSFNKEVNSRLKTGQSQRHQSKKRLET